jgi:tetratricopeptide (TPR) repeat protein
MTHQDDFGLGYGQGRVDGAGDLRGRHPPDGVGGGRVTESTGGTPAWAERLRAERRRRLWSKKEMAVRLLAAAGDAASAFASRDGLIRMVGYWEKGDRQVNDRYRTLYCRAFGIAEAELFADSAAAAAALAREQRLFDTLELARLAGASDLGPGTIEGIAGSVDLLCRAYPATPGAVLRDRTQRRLLQVVDLLGKRVTLAQHRELLVQAGWLSALLGCVHYDLGQVEEAETARQAAAQMGGEAGHDELVGWAFEMAAWFALVEGRFEAVVELARAGQDVAGAGNALVQLTLQEAKGHARLGARDDALDALGRGADLLERMPRPPHPEHHFVFDHEKWVFYAATIHAWLGDDDIAQAHASAVIAGHTRPDGSSRAPMRVANARFDLALVHARRGDLDAAVAEGVGALAYEPRSLSDLVARGRDLSTTLTARYPSEHLVAAFEERLAEARRDLRMESSPAA